VPSKASPDVHQSRALRHAQPGMGETYGKIDQVREALQTQTADLTDPSSGAE